MKHTQKIANGLRLFAITVLVTAIVFGMAACDDGGTDTHTHEWGAWTVTKAATCIEAGEESRECKLDGTHTEKRSIPLDPAAHVWGDWDVKTPATCTEDGVGTKKCSLCGEESPSNVIPALGHDYVWTVKTAATCVGEGEETGTCSHDTTHTTMRAIAIDPNAHDWDEWTVTAPTLISASVETRECKHDPSHTETLTVGDSLPITTTALWGDAITLLQGKTGGEYTLNISGDIGVAGFTSYFGTTAEGSSLSVTLKGTGKLYLTSIGSLITIWDNQTLIIDSKDLTLQGLKIGQNDATQNNSAGSIVVVFSGGTLELQNGTLSGNSNNSWGGGVLVNGGTFIMRGGVISGNTGFHGGGVALLGNSIFRIVTGTIYGSNEVDESLRNTLFDDTGLGAALYVESTATAQRGTFSGGEWIKAENGDLSRTSNTIKVLNGDSVL
jgi:hypothetical protein